MQASFCFDHRSVSVAWVEVLSSSLFLASFLVKLNSMRMKVSKPAFLLAGILVLAVVLGFFFFHKSTDPRTAGLTKVPGYVDGGVCAALSPSCGLCYGQVIDKECYVDKAKLTSEQLHYMGF